MDTSGSRIRGVILAGAFPWENSIFDRLAPRPLLPVANRPIISHVLAWFDRYGLRNVVICTNRETREVESIVAAEIASGMTVEYDEDSMPRGAAGCVRDVARRSDAAMFVVAEGAAIPSVDLADLIKAHHHSGAAITVVAHNEPCRQASRSGRHPARLIPNGIYIFERRSLEIIRPHGFFDIKESLIPLLYSHGVAVLPYVVDDNSPRVLDISTYLTLNEWAVRKLGDTRPSRTEGVAKDAVIIGPVVIGAGVSIHSGATIIGPTSLGHGSVVEHGAFISRSAVWNRCVIGRDAIVDRSVLADDVAVKPKTHVLSAAVFSPLARPAASRSRRDVIRLSGVLQRLFSMAQP